MTHVRIFVLLFLIAALYGCEDTPSEVIDFTGSAPVLRSTSVSPSLFNLDQQQMTGGAYRLSSTLTAAVSDPQGLEDIREVAWSVYPPGGGSPIARGALGPIAGNPLSPTREYTSVASFDVTRSATGAYRMEIVAIDGSSLRSTIVQATLTVRLSDQPPVLSLPGARHVPVPGTDGYYYALTVFAADSSGLNDISQVTVRAIGSKDSSAKAMVDDGNRSLGDAVAGDGVYSTYLWVFPTTTVQEVVFEYRAVDRAGSQSNPLRRSASNEPPLFVSLTVPSVIQRPASGSTAIAFFASVADPNGLSDIDSVYFRNLSSTSPVPFLMYDDGNLTQHGDSVAADGRYSVVVSISSTNSTGAKDFRFSVVDRAGARADTSRVITIN
jgi:hypothetical protein